MQLVSLTILPYRLFLTHSHTHDRLCVVASSVWLHRYMVEAHVVEYDEDSEGANQRKEWSIKKRRKTGNKKKNVGHTNQPTCFIIIDVIYFIVLELFSSHRWALFFALVLFFTLYSMLSIYFANVLCLQSKCDLISFATFTPILALFAPHKSMKAQAHTYSQSHCYLGQVQL